MQLAHSDNQRFRWGLVLAWIPLAFVFVGLANAFRGVLTSKATGLGAVAGGLAEVMVSFGFVSLLVTQVSALVLLSRGFSREHIFRNLLAVVTMGLSLLALAVMGLFVCLSIYLPTR